MAVDYTNYGLALMAGIFLGASFSFDEAVKQYFLGRDRPWIKGIMYTITKLRFLVFAFFLLVLSVLIFGGGLAKVLFVCTAILVILLFTYIFKFIVMRKRPKKKELIPLIGLVDYSFPSAHSAFAFGCFALLGQAENSTMLAVGIIWLVFSSAIAFSRLYADEHYFSDVVAGITFGYFTGLLLLIFESGFASFLSSWLGIA